MTKRCMTHSTRILIIFVALAAGFAGLRCGSEKLTGTAEYAYADVMLSVGSWAEAAYSPLVGGPVDMEAIESLLVMVDRVSLNVSAEDDSLGQVTVFDASEQPAVDNEIDLIDLAKLSTIVSGVEVPPGDYGQVRMEIADPRLALVGDPAGEYRTNVSLTANGRLFAEVELTIMPADTLDLHLVLEQLHLVEKGNGDFVLTPQLRVEIVPET